MSGAAISSRARTTHSWILVRSTSAKSQMDGASIFFLRLTVSLAFFLRLVPPSSGRGGSSVLRNTSAAVTRSSPQSTTGVVPAGAFSSSRRAASAGFVAGSSVSHVNATSVYASARCTTLVYAQKRCPCTTTFDGGAIARSSDRAAPTQLSGADNTINEGKEGQRGREAA